MKKIKFKTHAERNQFFNSMLNNYLNGNLSDFRNQLSLLSTREVLNFISNGGDGNKNTIEEMFLIVDKFI